MQVLQKTHTIISLLLVAAILVMTSANCHNSITDDNSPYLSGDTLDPLPFPDSLYADFYKKAAASIDERLAIHRSFKNRKFTKTIRILASINILDTLTRNSSLFVLSWVHLKDSLSNQCWGLIILERQCDSSRCQGGSDMSSSIVDYFGDNIRSLPQDQYDSALIDIVNRPASRTFLTQLNDSIITAKEILDFANSPSRLGSVLTGFIPPAMEDGEESLHCTAKTIIRERTWKAMTGDDPNHSIPVAQFLREMELYSKMNEYHSTE